jgi:ribonuclease D
MLYRGDEISTEYISSDADLARACSTWSGAVGLDTEFIRTDTYYPIPGLYQVCCGEDVWLIDPLEISDWAPFQDVLIDPEITKVMHACSEDLELMSHHLDLTPVGIFDTQVAHAFLAEDFSTSYARLVEDELNVQLDKHETRSDWLKRPLTERQITYAAEDVIYLVEMFEKQTDALQTLGRLTWFEQDMAQRSIYNPVEPVNYYRGVKKAWRLSGDQLRVLKALCAWREQEARRSNVPRRRVVWDEHLYHFASIADLTEADIADTVPRGVARKHAPTLLDVHEMARAQDPLPPLDRPLTPGQGSLMREMRASARQIATDLGMAAELLARKKDVEECVRCHLKTGELSEHYRGWRSDVVGGVFTEMLSA